MPSALDDLLVKAAFGRTTWKMPCRAVATTNVVLQGLQTVDTVPLQPGERVLLTGQTAAKDNGPWVVFNGAWTRPSDFDVNYKIRTGCVFLITAGTDPGALYVLDTPATGEIILGSTAMGFSKGAGGGTFSSALDTTDQLAALDSTVLPDGAAVRVNAQRDTWYLRKAAGLLAIPNEVITVGPGGVNAWVRGGTPDPSWIRQMTWYIDASDFSGLADDDNDGADPDRPLLTVKEFLLRCTRNFYLMEGEMVVNIMSNVSEDVFIEANFDSSVVKQASLRFSGSAYAEGTNGSITTSTNVNPATNTPASIVTNVDWNERIPSVCIVTGGVSTGGRFVANRDLGSNTAQLGNINANVYDITPVTLQIGDDFLVLQPVEFTGSLTVRGTGTLSFDTLRIGNTIDPDGHGIQIYNATCFFYSCILPNGVNADRNSYVDCLNCAIQLGCRAQDNSTMLLSGSSVLGGQPIARASGTMYLYNSSSFGTYRTDAMGLIRVDAGFWASVHNTTVGLRVDPSAVVDMRGGRIWGSTVVGPRIDVKPGGSVYLSATTDLNIAGSGAEISVGGAGGATTFVGLPSLNSNNAAKVVVST